MKRMRKQTNRSIRGQLCSAMLAVVFGLTSVFAGTADWFTQYEVAVAQEEISNGKVMVYYDNSKSNWSNVYCYVYNDDTQVSPTPTSEPIGQERTIYYREHVGWDNVYAHYWSDSTGTQTEWPGVLMTKVEDNIYKVSVPNSTEKIKFNNNGDQATQDFTIPSDKNYYANGWITYQEIYVPNISASALVVKNTIVQSNAAQEENAA